jgi:hypothetical protein
MYNGKCSVSLARVLNVRLLMRVFIFAAVTEFGYILSDFFLSTQHTVRSESVLHSLV